MVFKAPKYIADLIISYQNTRNLRSWNQMILHVPKTRLKSKGDMAFSVYGALFQCILNLPHLWMLLSLD